MSGGMESMVEDAALAVQIQMAEQKEDFATAEFGDDVPVHPLDVQIGGDHYKKYAIQPVEYIIANNLGFCAGNVIKYITRFDHYEKQSTRPVDKGGTDDLKKARHYIDLLIAMAGE